MLFTGGDKIQMIHHHCFNWGDKMKRTKVLLFVLVLVMFALFFSGVKFRAAEIQTSDAINVLGAQVRTDDPLGIRFVGAAAEEYDKYGIAIAFGKANVDEVVLGATVNGEVVLSAETSAKDEDGQFYISLISIPENMYVQDVTARAYAVKDGVYTYATTATVRNLAQVSLAVKNAGGEVVDSVIEYVEENYMKTYKIGDYVHVNNAVYEYEPTQLAKLFVEDFNKVTGENIESMKNFAFTYKLNPTASATKEVVASSKLYQFFNANNQEMLAKWGWVLDYIKTVDTNTFSLAQMKLCKTLEANLTAEVSDWYGMQHLLSRLESFFTRAVVANNGLSYQSNLFANPEKYLNLVSFIDSLENKLYTVGSYELVKTNNTIVLPEYDTPNGYAWDGYFAGEEKFEAGEEYVITNTNVVFVPKTHAQEYTIKYFNGEEEFSELAGTYTVNNEVTLPNLDLEDYDFYGWYTSPTFEESTKVTKIAKGSTGNKVYYAKLVAQLYKEVNVTFDPNGGFMRYASTEAAIADFLKDYNAAKGKSHTAETFAALGSMTEISQASTFLYTATYKAKWAWLVEYIATVASSANKKAYASFLKYNSQSELNSVNSNYIYSIAYELRGWVGQIKYSKNSSFVTADYSSESVKASALAAAQGETSFVYKDPCTLPIPNKLGYKFLGWKSSLDGKIYTEYPGYKPNPGDITYVAQWEEVKTIVELSKNESQLIDELNPQIFVSSSFDDGKYDINGESYVFGDKVFSSIADALSAAKSGDVIYVFAGTYADALIIDKSNITIAGSNYGVAYNETRNNEAIISGKINVAANDFTLNGVKFTGTQILATANISNLSLLNIISTSNGDSTNGGRTAVVATDSYTITGLIVKYSSFTMNAANGYNIFAFYSTVSNTDIQYNEFSNGGLQVSGDYYNEVLRANKVSGTHIFANNYCLWSTDNFAIYYGSSSNASTSFKINDNVIKGDAGLSAGISVRNLPASSKVEFIGNEISLMGGSLLDFKSANATSVVDVMYNLFGEAALYKISNTGSSTINYVNNYYATTQTTVTSDYGVIASVQALKEAYAAYKAQ